MDVKNRIKTSHNWWNTRKWKRTHTRLPLRNWNHLLGVSGRYVHSIQAVV